MPTSVKKFLVEIQTDPHTGYGPKEGWDSLHDSRQSAEGSCRRAANLFCGARVVPMDVPSHVDHLYAWSANDATALYAIAGTAR